MQTNVSTELQHPVPFQSLLAEVSALWGKADNRGAEGWLQELRQVGLESLSRQGLPQTSWEGWRYTSLRALEEHPLTIARPSVTPATGVTPSGDTFASVEAWVVTVVDGVYVPELSAKELPGGVTLYTLADAHRPEVSEILQGRLGQGVPLEEESFAALNTALLRDGVVLHVGRGVTVSKPIHLRFVRTTSGDAQHLDTQHRIVHPRALVVLDERAEVTVLESYLTAHEGDGESLGITNAVTELQVGPGARLTHLRLQNESHLGYHFAAVHTELQRDATLRSFSVALGSKTSRITHTARFAEPGGTCDLTGLGVVRGHQHLDNYSVIHHAAPHCTSRELFKNILDERASTVFNAKIVVHQAGQKTDGTQRNQNLVLSKHAVANTRPQLEIYNDDVKCAHGATVGQLDADQLFYLRARGLSERDARAALTVGFAREILDVLPVPEEARVSLEQTIRQGLEAGAQRGVAP